jgi:hypothetical protein
MRGFQQAMGAIQQQSVLYPHSGDGLSGRQGNDSIPYNDEKIYGIMSHASSPEPDAHSTFENGQDYAGNTSSLLRFAPPTDRLSNLNQMNQGFSPYRSNIFSRAKSYNTLGESNPFSRTSQTYAAINASTRSIEAEWKSGNFTPPGLNHPVTPTTNPRVFDSDRGGIARDFYQKNERLTPGHTPLSGSSKFFNSILAVSYI